MVTLMQMLTFTGAVHGGKAGWTSTLIAAHEVLAEHGRLAWALLALIDV